MQSLNESIIVKETKENVEAVKLFKRILEIYNKIKIGNFDNIFRCINETYANNLKLQLRDKKFHPLVDKAAEKCKKLVELVKQNPECLKAICLKFRFTDIHNHSEPNIKRELKNIIPNNENLVKRIIQISLRNTGTMLGIINYGISKEDIEKILSKKENEEFIQSIVNDKEIDAEKIRIDMPIIFKIARKIQNQRNSKLTGQIFGQGKNSDASEIGKLPNEILLHIFSFFNQGRNKSEEKNNEDAFIGGLNREKR